jgi:hypothetical protein
MARKNNTKPAEAAAPSFPSSEALIADGFTTKSARIRELHRLGMATGDIARQETNGLYQHAYNVIKKPLKGRATPAAAPVAEAPQGDETDASE